MTSTHCDRVTHSLATSVKLLVEGRGREGLAAQPAAADGAAAERKKDARVSERGENRLLDLIEGDAAPAHAVRTLERTRNLPDAAAPDNPATVPDRIAVDDRLQHDRVVGVQPERHLFVTRRGRDVRAASELTNSSSARDRLERPVIHEAVANVQVERSRRQRAGSSGHDRVCREARPQDRTPTRIRRRESEVSWCVATIPDAQESRERGVEGLRLLEIRQVSGFRDEHELRALIALCISRSVGGGVSVSSSPTTTSVGT